MCICVCLKGFFCFFLWFLFVLVYVFPCLCIKRNLFAIVSTYSNTSVCFLFFITDFLGFLNYERICMSELVWFFFIYVCLIHLFLCVYIYIYVYRQWMFVSLNCICKCVYLWLYVSVYICVNYFECFVIISDNLISCIYIYIPVCVCNQMKGIIYMSMNVSFWIIVFVHICVCVIVSLWVCISLFLIIFLWYKCDYVNMFTNESHCKCHLCVKISLS